MRGDATIATLRNRDAESDQFLLDRREDAWCMSCLGEIREGLVDIRYQFPKRTTFRCETFEDLATMSVWIEIT